MLRRRVGRHRWTRVTRRRLLFCLLPASVLLAGCATPALWKPWVEVRTENFRIASAWSAAETEALARDLEAFRAVAKGMTKGARFEETLPTRIYVFGDSATYRDFGGSWNTTGYFTANMRENVVALSRLDEAAATRTVKHEFVHFVLRNQGAYAYPRWFDEGFAQLLETIEIEGDRVQLGAPPHDDLRFLSRMPWIPLSEVLAARDLADFSPAATSMFYFESWALVHYLHFGRDGDTPLGRSLTRYLRSRSEGHDVDTALRRGFGVDAAELDERVRAHLEKGEIRVYSLPLDRFESTASEPRSRPLDEAEVATLLGWLALFTHQPERGEKYFEAAIEAGPMQARAHAGLGDALKFQKRWDAAAPHYARALELAPEDALSHLDYAEYLADRAAAATDAEERSQLLSVARRHFVESQRLDASIPETYAIYGATFLLEGQDPSGGVETLEHAHRMLRSDLDIKLLLARLYLRLGRYEEARELAQAVRGWAHGDEQAEAAATLLGEIDSAEALDAAAAPTGQPS